MSFGNYPEMETIIQQINASGFKTIFVDAAKTAREAGSPRTENVVMVGVAAQFLGIEKQQFENSLKEMFGSKGEDIVHLNLKAFQLGYELAVQS